MYRVSPGLIASQECTQKRVTPSLHLQALAGGPLDQHSEARF